MNEKVFREINNLLAGDEILQRLIIETGSTIRELKCENFQLQIPQASFFENINERLLFFKAN